MNKHQQDFLAAFEAWNAQGMADALVGIVQELLGPVECSATTRGELIWSSRELLESMQLHPAIGLTILVPEGPFSLHLDGGVQWSGASVPARHPKVTLQLAPSALESAVLKKRWRSLGLVDKTITIERDKVRTPAPLKGEPGYLGYQPDQPSIHRPDQQPRDSPTYAAALSLGSSGPRPYLDRYLSGECIQVWADLVMLGERVREGSILPDALAVALETMRRCRDNIERLHERLQAMNYVFINPEEAFLPPAADVLGQIADLERRVGPLPLSVCAWYQIVGSVDFTGSHPDWSKSVRGEYPDPLVILPSSDTLEYDEENWYRGRYNLDMAPDAYHKEDMSGGPPYTVVLPNPAIDAPLEHERHVTTFVGYLRTCFQWGPFPGWEKLPRKDRRGALLGRLTQDLIEI